MSENKDTIFEVDKVAEDFKFSSRVVEVFDDMLDRSIPFYNEVISASAALMNKHLRTGDTIFDLGSATGNTLLELSRMLQCDDLHYIGIDTSPAMLEKAKLKVELYSKQKQFTFLEEDITGFNHQNAGTIILHYTLQFIRPPARARIIKTLYDNLRPGGILLLSEKTICHDKILNRGYIDIYHSFKKKKGYSELEIAKKREALENVLIPFSISENKELLHEAGFVSVETFFQWFNFASFIALK